MDTLPKQLNTQSRLNSILWQEQILTRDVNESVKARAQHEPELFQRGKQLSMRKENTLEI